MKKNQSYVWISFIVLIFGIYAIPKIISRVKNGTIVSNDRLVASAERKTVKSDLFEVGSAPKFNLTDQSGKTVSNEAYKGKVYVLEFFFTTCPTICPIMNKNMKDLVAVYGSNPDFGVASITINPKNDTPEVLKNHAKALGINNGNWHFLTGKEEDIFDLSNKGFNLYAGINPKIAGRFEHSGLFALIDKNGNIRCRKDQFDNPIVYYDGMDKTGIAMIKQDIQKLLNE